MISTFLLKYKENKTKSDLCYIFFIIGSSSYTNWVLFSKFYTLLGDVYLKKGKTKHSNNSFIFKSDNNCIQYLDNFIIIPH